MLRTLGLLCLLAVTSAQLRGVNYGIQKPDGSCTGYNEVLADFKVIATFAQAVKIYNLGYCNGAQNSLQAASVTGLKVFLGMTAGDANAYNSEKNVLRQVYAQYGFSNVLGITIGSEDLYRKCNCEQQLANQITEVKNLLKSLGNSAIVPVTHTDVYYLQPAAITNVADIIMFNAFSFWEGVSIDNAVQTFIDHYNTVKQQFPGKAVWVGETGWPVNGAQQGAAVPSAANAKAYINGIVCWANANGVPYFYFEAFDEPWKASQDAGPIETSFGVYNADRSRKSYFQVNCPGASSTTNQVSSTTSKAASSTTGQPATSTTGQVFPNNAALYWNFDSIGSTQEDKSGNNHYGTLIGGGASPVPGVVGGAISLVQSNGLTTYRVNQGQSFANRFTALMWINIPRVLDVRMKLLSSKKQWDATTGFQIELYPTEMSISFVGGGGSVAQFRDLPFTFGSWNHVAVVNDGGYITLYLNGNFIASKGVAPAAYAAEQLFVGSDNTQADGVTGYLDELYIYNEALSAAQVGVIKAKASSTSSQAQTSSTTKASTSSTTKASTSSTTKASTSSTTKASSTTSQAQTSSTTKASTSSTTKASSTTNQNTPSTCSCPSNLGCCNGQCFELTAYVCAVDQNNKSVLCPKNSAACNGGCYDPNLYTCGAGGLQQKN